MRPATTYLVLSSEMSQDYYEILQVHPRADQDAIAAAHARLRDLYSSAKLEGAAPELVELARTKRDAIDRAYAVLGDAARRASYDAEQADRCASRGPTTDYRPPRSRMPSVVRRPSSVPR